MILPSQTPFNGFADIDALVEEEQKPETLIESPDKACTKIRCRLMLRRPN